VGFSVPAGGTVSLAALQRLQVERTHMRQHSSTLTKRLANYAITSGVTAPNGISSKEVSVAEATSTGYQTVAHRQETPVLNTYINAIELTLLQQLAGAELNQLNTLLPDESVSPRTSWQVVEQILRQYTQYHLGRPIRSAALIDSYFASLPKSSQ